jgi:hypothetical protein
VTEAHVAGGGVFGFDGCLCTCPIMHTRTRIRACARAHTHTHTHTLSLSLALSLSHTHTYKKPVFDVHLLVYGVRYDLPVTAHIHTRTQTHTSMLGRKQVTEMHLTTKKKILKTY